MVGKIFMDGSPDDGFLIDEEQRGLRLMPCRAVRGTLLGKEKIRSGLKQSRWDQQKYGAAAKETSTIRGRICREALKASPARLILP
jgi:hypothetical protein